MLLESTWNVHICIDKSYFLPFTPILVRMEAWESRSKKYFTMNCMKCADLYIKNYVFTPYPYGSRCGLELSTQKCLPRNYMKWDLHRKPCLSLGFRGLVVTYQKIARNCMKYPDLQRKVIFLTHDSQMGKDGGLSSRSLKKFCYELHEICRSAHKSHVSNLLSPLR